MQIKDRLAFAQNSVAKKLLLLIDQKKTNLCVSADLSRAEEISNLAQEVGPEICILKIHIDIVENFTIDWIKSLRAIAIKHHFLLFEDRKFADIGNTVYLQYVGGMYQIIKWADIINAHSIAGPGTIHGLQKGVQNEHRGLLLLAQMSSQDNLIDPEYTKRTVQMAEDNKEFVIGFISQKRVSADPGLLHLTPGIKRTAGSDALGQCYRSLDEAFADGTDIIIVGRDIIHSENRKQLAQTYREEAWNAYQKNLILPSFL